MKQATKEDIEYQDTPNPLLLYSPSSIGEFLFTPNTSLLISFSSPIIFQSPNKRLIIYIIEQNSHNDKTSAVLIVCYNVSQIIGAITWCFSIKISQLKF